MSFTPMKKVNSSVNRLRKSPSLSGRKKKRSPQHADRTKQNKKSKFLGRFRCGIKPACNGQGAEKQNQNDKAILSTEAKGFDKTLGEIEKFLNSPEADRAQKQAELRDKLKGLVRRPPIEAPTHPSPKGKGPVDAPGALNGLGGAGTNALSIPGAAKQSGSGLESPAIAGPGMGSQLMGGPGLGQALGGGGVIPTLKGGAGVNGLSNPQAKKQVKLGGAGVNQAAGAQKFQMGQSGNDVKALQRKLVRQGAKLKLDGIFGPKTSAALKAYEKQQTLVDQRGMGGGGGGLERPGLGGPGLGGPSQQNDQSQQQPTFPLFLKQLLDQLAGPVQTMVA